MKVISIKLAHETERELQTKVQLENILARYDLDALIYTQNVIIDQKSIPHSHPILTLHTRHLNEPYLLLATFIHEQIHWFLLEQSSLCNIIIEKLKEVYQNVPVGFPMGAHDENSTYLHLIVNYLEFISLKKLIGDEKALDVIGFWSNDHYTWVYKQILKDYKLLGNIFKKFGLNI